LDKLAASVLVNALGHDGFSVLHSDFDDFL
jgi:hypothetical protein